MKIFRKIIEETDVLIKSDNEKAIKKALKSIEENRRLLKIYLKTHPLILYSLTPVSIESNAPEIVKRMVEASNKAYVGPMASVAGALADLALKEMVKEGAEVALIENGGEIAVNSKIDINISIYAANSPLSKKFGFKISQKDCPLGIGTSSSKSTRALSFGDADAVTVIAENAAVADASATAICNIVKGEPEEAIQKGLNLAKKINTVKGAIIIKGNHIGLWGKLPKLLEINELF
ncbi:UPF0280 family protein [Candidatus Bathyarchaeota archaeon]|nr:UPF0280 family protein [Candidatus Bathyarchaeota archaeon]